jgi:DNA-binding transcriptional ArsR family regulator
MSSPHLDLAELGALLGDPARASMLTALIGGRALTATELAQLAGVAPQTASGHLAKLRQANLLDLRKQGKHRYYRVASPLVASMLESVMSVAAVQLPPRRLSASRLDAGMRAARTCYDHIAGRLGVAIAEALIARDYVLLAEDGGEVTPAGADFLAAFGAAVSPKGLRRVFCRPCLDWSERRWHIAGAVGAALCNRCIDLHWIERRENTRALTITPKGCRGFADHFGVSLDQQ